MDILYFQGVRPFRLGGNYHGHPLLPRGTTLEAGGAIMDILYFQGVRPFRLGGELSCTSFTSKGTTPGGEISWTSFTSKGYDPLGLAWSYHGHPLLPMGTTLEVGGGTVMDILYFQGVRPFRLGGNYHGHPFTSKGYDLLGWGELSWTSFTSKGYGP